jgi:hypothetical protein
MRTITVLFVMMTTFTFADDVKIPRDGTETSLVRVKADPQKHFGPAPFKIVGGVGNLPGSTAAGIG